MIPASPTQSLASGCFLLQRSCCLAGCLPRMCSCAWGADAWPGMETFDTHEMATRADQILSVPLATLNTVILIASSVTMVLSWAALKMDNFKGFKLHMGLTILLALGFLVVKAFEYGSKFSPWCRSGDEYFSCDLLCAYGIACHSRDGWHNRQRILLGPWGQAVAQGRCTQQSTLHQSDRGSGPVLAFCRLGLDFPFSDDLPSVIWPKK